MARFAGVYPDFDELYVTGFSRLRSQLYAYLDDRQEAQDAVQEAFCRALLRWETVRRHEDPALWVGRAAWNLATSVLRRRETATRYLDGIALITALQAIQPQPRQAVIMYYLGELSIAEIAAQEEVAEGTAKNWLGRGRAALGRQLTVKAANSVPIDDLIHGALVEFRAFDAATPLPVPDKETAYSTVRHRRRTRRTRWGAVGAAMVTIAVALAIALASGKAPPPVTSDSPRPAASAVP